MNTVIVNCFDTYEHRVDLLHDYFVRMGADVRVYTSSFRHFEKRERTDKKEDYIYISTKPYYRNMSFSRLYSHYKFSKDVFESISMQNVDLLWVLIPPNSCVADAAGLKMRKPGMKLVFDVIDMWPETMPVTKLRNFYPIRKWRKLRDDYIDRADYVVTECNLYQSKLRVDSGKMSTIYLAREVKPFKSNPDPHDDAVSLCYLGSINNIVDIEEIKRIIVELGRIKPVILHIIGDGERREELVDVAKSAGADVIYHGRIYDAGEKQKIFDICHYGLNIMKESVFVGLTMKSIDYLEAGLPIINNIGGDTWDLIEKYDFGINIDKLSSYDYKSSRREKARSFFEENLSVECFEKRVQSVYDKLEL